jgi:tRNA(Arg) A34 adenosine deaminase TadA
MDTAWIALEVGSMKRRDLLVAAGGAAIAAVTFPAAERVSAQATPVASSAASAEDEWFMRIALDEARQADFPFGAVIVRNGEVLARGFNSGRRDDDPTAHGEMQAIRAFLAEYDAAALRGTTLYTTGEPCVMCTGAIIWCGIRRIVYAASIADLATKIDQIMLTSAEIVATETFAPVAITGGVLSEEALALFK